MGQHGRNRAGVIAIGALVVISLGATSAGAAKLIDSWDVKDNSLKSIDVKDRTLMGRDVAPGTITGNEVRDGSLSADDFNGSLNPGPTADDTVYTWTASYVADGSTEADGPLLTSTDKLPAMAHLTALDLEVNGDFSICDYGALDVHPANSGIYRNGKGSLATAHFWDSEAEIKQVDVGDLQSWPEPAPLVVVAQCLGSSDDFSDGRPPIPSFDLSITFKVEEIDASDPQDFD